MKARDNRQSELIQTIKSLREELQTVRANNEQILKTQEELNAIFLNKLCDQNYDRNTITSKHAYYKYEF
jgi:hypothetical protein